MFKKTVKALLKIYDIVAHIVGHLVLIACIIGGIYYEIAMTHAKGDLIYVLIEIIIILSLILLVILIIHKIKKKLSKKKTP